MPPVNHALLSASSSKRWITCPPSARLEAGIPEGPEKDYSREGTLAHELAELILSGDQKRLKAWYKRETGPDATKAEDGTPFYGKDMEGYIRRYCEQVNQIMDGYRLAGMNPELHLEYRVDYSEWAEGGFGTSDVVIVTDETLHIIDLKYGKGVPVSAEGNTQLRCYALGAYKDFSLDHDLSAVAMTIIQPRLDSLSGDAMTVEELLGWARAVLKPAAQLAWKGEGDYRPTPEACRFCKARFSCRWNAAYMLTLAGAPEDPKAAPLMTPLEIAGLLEKLDDLTKWANGVKEYALNQAISGEHYPGWKVVEGRSLRIITDEAKAAAALEKEGYTPDQTMKLRGLTDLEKLVGKKKLTDTLGDLIQKPAGKPTLAREDDKRPAIDPKPKDEDYGM